MIYYNVGASKEELRDRNMFGQIENIYCFTPSWKLRVGAKFNWAATLYSDKNRQEEEGYYKENYFQREYYATANLLFNPTKSWSFDYSLDYAYNNLNSNQKIDSRPWRHSVLQSLSAKFINNRFTAIARMILSVYDGGSAIAANAGGTDYTHLSPSLSISSKLLSNGLLFGRISYKNIFRMPTFNEAYFKHFGSPDLKPESTHQLNIGLTYQLPSISWLPYTSITMDGYRNIVKDRIVAIPYNMFVWTITNLKNVNVWGADVTLNSTFKINEKQQLLLSGTWSYQRAMINASKGELLWHKQVAYTPLNSGAFSLSYENPWVNLVIHGQGLSSRYTENSNIAQSHLPGYFEFGVTLWKTFRWRQQSLEARVDINNILDKQYVIIARYPMPGRSLMISLKYSI